MFKGIDPILHREPLNTLVVLSLCLFASQIYPFLFVDKGVLTLWSVDSNTVQAEPKATK